MNPSPATPLSRAVGGVRSKVGQTLEAMADAIKDAILDWEEDEAGQDDGGLTELPPLEPVLFVAALREKVEDVLWRMAEAVNEAPTGQIVAASEGRVRELLAELYREALELGLQMRLDAGEAGLPPGQRPRGTWARRLRRLKAGGLVIVPPDPIGHETSSCSG